MRNASPTSTPGELTARERIAHLTDKDTHFLEIGAFAGDGMYQAEGGCPSGGVVTGIGYVQAANA